MAWMFLNIGKANQEIDRLNAELAAVTKERDEARTALEANHTFEEAEAATLNSQLASAQASVTELKAAVKAKDAEMATMKAELQKAQEQLANPSAQIVKIAAVKAAEITGAQGQPAVPTAPVGTPAGGVSGEGLLAQMREIKDPTARTVFYRKNQAAILAASREERR